MFVMEAEALATLAPIAGQGPEVVSRLQKRANDQRQLIAYYLWDGENTQCCAPTAL